MTMLTRHACSRRFDGPSDSTRGHARIGRLLECEVVLNNTRFGMCCRQRQRFAVRRAYFLPTLPAGTSPALGSSTEWMLGSTPPAAMVTAGAHARQAPLAGAAGGGGGHIPLPSSLDSSSSLRIASWMWRGTMLRGAGGA